MKRLALTAGGLLLLAGPAFAQNQGSTTKETRTQQQTQEIQKSTPPSTTTTPNDVNQMNQPNQTGDINRADVQKQRGTETTQTEPMQNADEPKKHLTAVELYTKSALDNAKLLYQAAELPQGPMDKSIFKEAQQNISRDLQKADQHLTQFKSMAKATAPQSQMDVTAKRDDLVKELKDAKVANAKLGTALTKDRAAVRDAAAQVFTALNQANDSLKDIEDAYNVQQLDKVMPNEKAPVRGTEDMEKSAPGTTTEPGPSKGKTEMNEKTAPPDTTTLPATPPSNNEKKETPKSPNY
jgi:hypothetical protein